MALTRSQILKLLSNNLHNNVADSIYTYMTLANDGSTISAAVDGSSVAKEFIFSPSGRVAIVYRVILYIEDNANFRVQDYGGISGGLTNGILLGVYDSDDVILLDLTDGLPIKTNGSWSRLCYDVNHLNYGSGNEVLTGRWTFEKSGRGLLLRDGDQLKVTIQDDLTGLVHHTFMVQGYYI